MFSSESCSFRQTCGVLSMTGQAKLQKIIPAVLLQLCIQTRLKGEKQILTVAMWGYICDIGIHSNPIILAPPVVQESCTYCHIIT